MPDATGAKYRTAEDHLERLPALADNLVRLKVAAIIATSHAAALAAQAATKSIPIIFFVGTDPVDTGLVSSLNRPGGNLTGVAGLGTTSLGKFVELLHELVPTASIAYLTNVLDPGSEAPQFEVAARTLGIRSHVVDPGGLSCAAANSEPDRARGMWPMPGALPNSIELS